MPLRNTLTRQIGQVQDELLVLGSMVEHAALGAVDALKRRDVKAAKAIFEEDQQINEKRFAIENAILILMATQQPMAHDLRQLAAMLEVNTELERIGDYAKGIAKVTMLLGDADIPIPIQEIDQMAQLAVSMLHRALGAFVAEDVATALEIPKEDDKVDELYNVVYRLVVQTMISNPETIDLANLLMWVAHNLERMADRVTNICERAVFCATGELFEVNGMDEDDLNV